MDYRKAVGISLDAKTKRRLDECPLTGIASRSAVVRLAVNEYIDRWQRREGIKSHEIHKQEKR